MKAVALFVGFVIASASQPFAAEPGLDIYMQSRCFACHGQLGYGGAGPRFRNNKLLAADDYVVGQILLGRGIMPSFAGELSNEQIAAVGTYIRESWGNNFGPITPEQVDMARKKFGETDKVSGPQELEDQE